MKQKIIIKVSMHCRSRRTKALKIAALADGVISVALHGPEKDKLMIIGDEVDAACLTVSLRKKLCHASLEIVEEVKDPPPPNPPAPPPPNPPVPNLVICCPPQPPFELYTVVSDPCPGACTIF